MAGVYIGIGDDRIPSLGTLELEVFRALWMLDKPSTIKDIHRLLFNQSIKNGEVPRVLYTIRATLRRMEIKNMVTRMSGKTSTSEKTFLPTRTRDEVMNAVINDVKARIMSPL